MAVAWATPACIWLTASALPCGTTGSGSKKSLALWCGRANQRIVKHEGQDKSLRVVVQELEEQKAFHYSREVEYQGKAATQYVAETKVVIDRPAKPQRTKHHKGEGRRVAGCGHRITSHCESDHRRGGCVALRVVAVDEPPSGGASRC